MHLKVMPSAIKTPRRRRIVCSLKAPIYFKQNRRMTIISMMTSFQTKSGRNKVRFEFVLAVRNSSPKSTFWGSLFWLLNTFELPLVCGDYSIGGCVLKLLNFFFPVHFSFNGGQTGERHLLVTSNMNTLECWIAELAQIYPHLRSLAEKM